MCEIPRVIKNPELLYLMSIKRMAERIDTCVENIKTIYPDSSIRDKFSFIDTVDSTLYPGSRPNIIHFFGSSQDEFYHGVSLYYMRGGTN